MFTLPQLPYQMDGLEPHISSKTLEFHYGKHHAAYMNKLNEAIHDYNDLKDRTIEEILINFDSIIPVEIKDAVRKNGAQYYNHNLYWISMSPQGGGKPEGELGKTITDTFGSYEQFMEEFTKHGTSQFGSGWIWLSCDTNGELSIDKTSNEDTPLMHGKTPILTMDVWEHAYYLDYQNRRPDYINAFFEVVDWTSSNERFEAFKAVR